MINLKKKENKLNLKLIEDDLKKDNEETNFKKKLENKMLIEEGKILKEDSDEYENFIEDGSISIGDIGENEDFDEDLIFKEGENVNQEELNNLMRILLTDPIIILI